MSAVLQQLFNGLVGGSFYALLALGLSVIFGMLGVVNFAHGAFYMLGAFGSYVLLEELGISFWISLAVVPLALGLVGVVLERLMVRRLIDLDPLYNFLLTFGLTLLLQDLVRRQYGIQSKPYERPELLSGSVNLGLFSYPKYQVFVFLFAVVVIGGLGSVFGSVVAGFLIGMLQAIGNFYVPALSQVSVFIAMALVLLIRPAGLFGREERVA